MDSADPDDPPLTADTLADLQAGLFDDETATRLRQRIRTDAAARQTMEALNRVRRDLAALGPEPSTHTVDRARFPRPARIAVAALGLSAVAAAVWLGVGALLPDPVPLPSRPTTIEPITVSRPPATIPLSDREVVALLDRAPDYGPLDDARRRASCLAGLGYPANTRILGAQPVDIAGHPAVLLVLPGDAPGLLAALAVAPTCSSANTGLSADRIVHQP
ncbi:hypothetical protein PT015_17535 [Candidatus Mycobacterium wuenschmannii]|uniref:Anti-sigma-M factor RsmA n=1 Tax=Candidatus Mycobacterium wuenschmannii TaxID=3027808 RepID=A0ABY8VSR5_9MYCO|nr:hypothetical protein [Candidatus Mycobacterium wuenschmannii]WIM86675.1 hypothetical protein PT015_17535 [Candidatus Mycobacterium wuenschmannii]